MQKWQKKKLWKLPGHSGWMYKFLLLHQGPTFPSLLAKKELFFKIGLLDEQVASYQEWETSIRLAQEVKFVHINIPLFIYHLHEGETISKNLEKDIAGYSYIVKKHQKEIIRIHGLKGLSSHYKILIKKCFEYKNKQIGFFIFKFLYINILSIFQCN